MGLREAKRWLQNAEGSTTATRAVAASTQRADSEREVSFEDGHASTANVRVRYPKL
jgi:hypothetical protein